jgi:CRP-like cAMP-binding protein
MQANTERREIDTVLLKSQVAQVLRTSRFATLPPAQLQRIIDALEVVPMTSGEVIVQQGERGQHYFVIGEGSCQVERERNQRRPALVVAQLGPGDAFGEEALIVGNRRTATVRASSDGALLRLPRDVFDEAIRRPMLRPLEFQQAEAVASQPDGVWLDVRTPAEIEGGMLTEALPIPLQHLRAVLGRLRRDRRYVVYCDKGMRSAVAAFLLAERGFDAQFLLGGLRRYGRLPIASGSAVAEHLDRTLPQGLEAEEPPLIPCSQKTALERGELVEPALPVRPLELVKPVPLSEVPKIDLDIQHFEHEQAAITTLRLRAGQIVSAVEHLARQRELAEAARTAQVAHNQKLQAELEARLAQERGLAG